MGTDRTVIAALGEKRDGAKQALETGDGVEKVVPIQRVCCVSEIIVSTS